MAKQRKRDLYEVLEDNIRKAIDETPEYRQASEKESVDAALSALNLIVAGLEMRRDEIGDEAESDD